MSKWWNSLSESERFEKSIELGVPDLPYSYMTEVEKKKIEEVTSYTNYGNQRGGNLIPAANGKSNMSSVYGDKDVEELTEVSLSYMNRAKEWWNKKGLTKWDDMRIYEKQKVINAFTKYKLDSDEFFLEKEGNYHCPHCEFKDDDKETVYDHIGYSHMDALNKSITKEAEPTHIGQKNHNIDKYLKIAEDDFLNDKGLDNDAYELFASEDLEQLLEEENGCWVCGTEIQSGMKYCQYHCDHDDFSDFTGKCRDCGKNIPIHMMVENLERELLTEIAKEGGKGSGRSGHQQWMRGATESPDYGNCKNCGISTEIRLGKCSMCGKTGSGESLTKKIADNTWSPPVCSVCNVIPYEYYEDENGVKYCDDHKPEVSEAVGLDDDWDLREKRGDQMPMGYQYEDPEYEDTGFIKEPHNQMVNQMNTLDKTELTPYDKTSYDWQEGGEADENKCESCGNDVDHTNNDGLCEDCERERAIDRMESIRDAYEKIERCTVCDSETHNTDSHYDNLSEENTYDRMKKEKNFYNKYDEELDKEENPTGMPWQIGEENKVKGAAVENVAHTTKICNCGFYTNDEGEMNSHEC